LVEVGQPLPQPEKNWMKVPVKFEMQSAKTGTTIRKLSFYVQPATGQPDRWAVCGGGIFCGVEDDGTPSSETPKSVEKPKTAEEIALDAKRPKIVSMTPANRATDVDPGLDAITVVFDRPMKPHSWAMCGGGPNYPATIGEPSYDEKGTTWTIHVKLKPDMHYRFWLNAREFDAFRSAEDVPLESVTVTFGTKSKPEAASADAKSTGGR
jgi:hypothetical protein